MTAEAEFWQRWYSSAKKQGSAAFGFRDVAFTSANGTQVPVAPGAATVLIQ